MHKKNIHITREAVELGEKAASAYILELTNEHHADDIGKLNAAFGFLKKLHDVLFIMHGDGIDFSSDDPDMQETVDALDEVAKGKIWRFEDISYRLNPDNSHLGIIKCSFPLVGMTGARTLDDVVHPDLQHIDEVLQSRIPATENGAPNLFYLVSALTGLLDEPYKDIDDYIYFEVRRMTLSQLFDILKECGVHEKETSGYKNDGDRPRDVIYRMKADAYRTVEGIVREEIAKRSENSRYCVGNLVRGVYKSMVYVPDWLLKRINLRSYVVNEEDAEIIWAWNYAVYHCPENLDLEDLKKMSEERAAYILCEILPSLGPYYDVRYKSFYWSPEHEKVYFDDMTDEYRKFRKELILPGDFRKQFTVVNDDPGFHRMLIDPEYHASWKNNVS